jgi:hypothetical protein
MRGVGVLAGLERDLLADHGVRLREDRKNCV